MSQFVAIAKTTECPPGQCIEVVAKGRIIALCNVDGVHYAIDGVCPHQGGPLGQGTLCGTTLTCPWHGWQFDVRDGQNLISKAIRHPTIQLRVDGPDILALL